MRIFNKIFIIILVLGLAFTLYYYRNSIMAKINQIRSTSSKQIPSGVPKILVYPDTSSFTYVDYRSSLDMVKLDFTTTAPVTNIEEYYSSNLTNDGWNINISQKSENLGSILQVSKGNESAKIDITNKVSHRRIIVIYEF